MTKLTTMKALIAALVALFAVATLPVACTATGEALLEDDTEEVGSSGEAGVGGAGDAATVSGTGGVTLGGDPVEMVTLSGRVMAPSAAFPISGALVFLTKTEPAAIPSGVYHYECDTLEGTPYTLSAADGTWSIDNVSTGTWQLVTRKGNFRRIREIEVTKGMDPAVPEEMTTLPSALSADGLDTIPSYAVVKTSPDLTHNLLAKFGLGDVDGAGNLITGTEQFDIYEDFGSTYPNTTALFDTQNAVNSYHMIFLPCNSSGVGVSFVNSHVQMLRDYVSAGGRIYNSCTVSLWSEASFPDYIDFYQADDPIKFDIGRRTGSAYTTSGNVLDQDLASWLGVVISESPSNVPFYNGYVTIDATNEVNDGHGLEEDGFVVKPYTWVTDNGSYPGSPLMVTYNYDYGKVFYSVYETSSGTVALTPQEYVLLYVILEVGVCENPPEIPT